MSKYEKRKVFLEFKIENMYENVQPQEPEEELINISSTSKISLAFL